MYVIFLQAWLMRTNANLSSSTLQLSAAIVWRIDSINVATELAAIFLLPQRLSDRSGQRK